MDEGQGAERLLDLIKWRGPQRATDVAAVLRITVEAARQQLVRLAADGLVEAELERSSRGRPSRRWRLTRVGHAQFPDGHGELTVRLIATVRSELGEAALERVIAAREAEMQHAYGQALRGADSVAARVAQLARIRSGEGYMAECRKDGAGFLLLENHCPICAAAAACQGFCRAELAVFRAILGAGVQVERIEHITVGARRCAYRITPVREGTDGMD